LRREVVDASSRISTNGDNGEDVIHELYAVEERLARWLFLTHDRMDGDRLGLKPTSDIAALAKAA